MSDIVINIDNNSLNQNNMNFNDNFDVIKSLGKGTFGEVFHVKTRNDLNQEEFAVKKIPLEDLDEKELLDEARILKKYGGDYVAIYHNSWIENKILYIQMELFSASLKDVIEEKSNCLSSGSNTNIMYSTEFFISWKLFEDIIDCVNYLHESKPPLMHRDLKPANILIKENALDGRFIKLCDFGLAKLGGMTTITHTQGQGTVGYMAPEVDHDQSRYNAKADIYSLGIIAFDLFEFCEERDENSGIITTLPKKSPNKLSDITKFKLLMTDSNPNQRPICSFISKRLKSWSFDENYSIEQDEAKTLISEKKIGIFFRNYLNYQLSLTKNEHGVSKCPTSEIFYLDRNKWKFNMNKSYGNIQIGVHNDTNREWSLWIGDRLYFRPGDINSLRSNCIYHHNFRAYDNLIVKTKQWARIYSDNEPKKYAGWMVYDHSAQHDNILYVIREDVIVRIVDNDFEEEKVQDVKEFTNVEETGMREIHWIVNREGPSSMFNTVFCFNCLK